MPRNCGNFWHARRISRHVSSVLASSTRMSSMLLDSLAKAEKTCSTRGNTLGASFCIGAITEISGDPLSLMRSGDRRLEVKLVKLAINTARFDQFGVCPHLDKATLIEHHN